MLLLPALLLFPSLALALPAPSTTPAAAADEVKSLPGWSGALPSKHYSGYILAAGNTKQLHYYLQEADTDAASKPVVLWLNGGPGATSLIGAFTELGQLVFNRDSAAAGAAAQAAAPTLFRNPLSWTTSANVLYLENPAGVGFSRCVDPESKCTSNDTSAALDGHEVLVGFFTRFPQFKTSKFFLTGESYAGVYIPMLLDEIYKQGVITNVAGVAIGNGCWGTGPGTNCGDVTGHSGSVKKIDVEYWLGRGLISAGLAKAANLACDEPVAGAWADPLSKRCLAAYKKLSTALGPMNIDNVDSFCRSSPGSLATLQEHRDVRRLHGNSSHRDPTTGLWRPNKDASGAASDDASADTAAAALPIGAVQMWCGAEAALNTWMALPEVATALHVVAGPHAFEYNIQVMDLAPLYTSLSQRKDLTFVIYNGQADANVPYNGQVNLWAKKARVVEDWAPWFRGPYINGTTFPTNAASAPAAGHYQSYRSDKSDGNSSLFHFVLVSGAGHEVPLYRPTAALWMLRSFVLEEQH